MATPFIKKPHAMALLGLPVLQVKSEVFNDQDVCKTHMEYIAQKKFEQIPKESFLVLLKINR